MGKGRRGERIQPTRLGYLLLVPCEGSADPWFDSGIGAPHALRIRIRLTCVSRDRSIYLLWRSNPFSTYLECFSFEGILLVLGWRSPGTFQPESPDPVYGLLLQTFLTRETSPIRKVVLAEGCDPSPYGPLQQLLPGSLREGTNDCVPLGEIHAVYQHLQNHPFAGRRAARYALQLLLLNSKVLRQKQL